MSKIHGRFLWCELLTTDVPASVSFYTAVIGWTATDSGVPGADYTILNIGDRGVAGVTELPAAAMQAGATPMWVGYIGADDVDAAAAKIQAQGGTLHYGPEDIPGIGRFAIIRDPQGARFTLFKPTSPVEPPELPPWTPGKMGWHELHAADRESAFTFYAGLFGWTKTEALDMGPMGIYQLFATGDEGAVGGMMTKLDIVPKPIWTYYHTVDDIETAVVRVTDNGGQVFNGPHQVPGGSWIAQCRDPQGTMFAIVGPDRPPLPDDAL